MILAFVTPLHAASGFEHWWLPTDYSTHGHEIDSLFTTIFWITVIAFFAVTIVLITFLVRYRSRPGRKAHYTHGNTKLEISWTIAPAVILAMLAIFSKSVWERYRYSETANDPNLARILVIGQQFKWNVIYPGPDQKFGRYLVFPKPTDMAWPRDKEGKPTDFAGVKGPAYLKRDDALKAINNYIANINPLGKVYEDADGKDDDYVDQPGRQIDVPVNRPIEVQLTSKDVIHDFFLPNFRVKLDAVPGMRGRVYFTATKSSAEREKETARVMKIDEIDQQMTANSSMILNVVVDETIQHPAVAKDSRGWRYFDTTSSKKETIFRSAAGIPADASARQKRFEQLKKSGVTELKVYAPGYFEVVCEELCGAGHYTMQGQLYVMSQDEYVKKYETKKSE